MTFTDDDLKRLKEYTETCIGNQEKDRGIADCILEIAPYDLRALLARLEAAERVCISLKEESQVWPPEFIDLLKAWRKAAGK